MFQIDLRAALTRLPGASYYGSWIWPRWSVAAIILVVAVGAIWLGIKFRGRP